MNPESPSSPSLHLPFALLAFAVAILLAAQIGSATQSAGIMRWQTETVKKQIVDMQALDIKMTEAAKNRETLVKQSTELQGQLQTLLTDLIALSATDDDAKKVIDKWNIKKNDTAPAADPTK